MDKIGLGLVLGSVVLATVASAAPPSRGAKATIEQGDQTLHGDSVAQAESGAAGVAGKDAPADVATIAGTVTYRERIALPPDAEMLIRLEDTSRADAPSEVIAEGIARIPHQVPISFELPYDPKDIKQTHRYQIRVTIMRQGTTLFVTDKVHYVLTGGAPAKADIVLRMLNQPSAPPKQEAPPAKPKQ
jgi:putative lipoprotein